MERDLCRYKEYTKKLIALYDRICKELDTDYEISEEKAQAILSDFVGNMGMLEAYKFIDLSLNQNEDNFKTFLLFHTAFVVNENREKELVIFPKEINY